MLSKLFAFSGYVVKLDIYDVKRYLKANKRRLYGQNGILWVKERNTTQVHFLIGSHFSNFFFLICCSYLKDLVGKSAAITLIPTSI